MALSQVLAPPASAGDGSTNEPGLDRCIDLAKTTAGGPWSCVGDQFSYQESSGEWTTLTLADSSNPIEWGGQDDGVHTMDDYDYWCETTPVCTRYKSSYIAEKKGNAAFGSGGEVWGSFDVVWRQNFNGKYNRYRLLLIWDSGSAVDSDYWRAQVRREVDFWADPTLGVALFSPATISSINIRAWSPSSTTLRQVSEPIDQTSATYHDDLYGYFFARGQRFGAGTLHLPDFKYRYPSLYYPGA